MTSIAERFWSKVDRRGPDECWPWMRAVNPQSYGRFNIGNKTTRNAHRVAWCLANDVGISTLSSSVVIRHRCDNPSCCNPEHLETGSQAENLRDMTERGRSTAGTRHPQATLSEDQVRQIRERRAAGEKLFPIAEHYDVSESAVSMIGNNRRWNNG